MFIIWSVEQHLVQTTWNTSHYLASLPWRGSAAEMLRLPAECPPGFLIFFLLSENLKALKWRSASLILCLRKVNWFVFVFFFFYLFCNLIWNRQTKPTLTERAFMFISHMPYFLCISLWRSHLIFRIFIFLFFFTSLLLILRQAAEVRWLQMMFSYEKGDGEEVTVEMRVLDTNLQNSWAEAEL